MKAFFIIVTVIAALVPYLVPTADASVGMIWVDDRLAETGGGVGAAVLLVWAMLGLRLLKVSRN